MPHTQLGERLWIVFAPSHRPFREWVAILRPDEAIWVGLLDEAVAFVSRERLAPALGRPHRRPAAS